MSKIVEPKYTPFRTTGARYSIFLDKPVVHVQTEEGTHIYYLVRSGYKHIYPGQTAMPSNAKAPNITVKSSEADEEPCRQ